MYDDQVDPSFRMGMIWFIFSRLFLQHFSGHYSMLGHIHYLWLGGEGSGLVTNTFLWPEYECGPPTANDPAEIGGAFKTMGALGIASNKYSHTTD